MQLSKFFKKTTYEKPDPITKARVGVLTFVGISIILLIVFLYRDFYQTVIYVQEVFVLKQEVSIEDINLIEFNKAYKIHEYKKSSIIDKIISDPFDTEHYIKPKDNEN